MKSIALVVIGFASVAMASFDHEGGPLGLGGGSGPTPASAGGGSIAANRPDGEQSGQLRELGAGGNPNLQISIPIPGGKQAQFQAAFLAGTKDCKLITVAHGFDDLFGSGDPNSTTMSSSLGKSAIKISRYPEYEKKAKENHAIEQGAKAAGAVAGAALGAAAGSLLAGAAAGAAAAGEGAKQATSALMAPPGDVAIVDVQDKAICEAMKRKQKADQRKYEFNVCKAAPQDGERVYIGSANKNRMVAGAARKETTSALTFAVDMDGKDIKQGDSGGAGLIKKDGGLCVAGVQSTADPESKDGEGYMSKSSMADLNNSPVKQWLAQKMDVKPAPDSSFASQPYRLTFRDR